MNILSNFNAKEVSFLIYILIINIVSFLAFGLDKSKSKKNDWRISELSLMILALLGGSAGALLGMIVFKHKVSKAKFSLGIPLMYILNKVLELVILNYLK
ncbi:DUF1294 domain-containing protein [Clostridium sp. Cult2]|uniref:DUF1294 domain-containing protein n=1 Tax=Clostridium sp. Cult2 TaxID=2079003 RepID=UPI001F1C5CE9|nr:DUF1294 domain-containing protein [Clostridium sp. Cult2]MCF6464854.1 DUF1294 domain-containing protein [Clostridium sp. Cult2]